jgi:oligoendopeptidase F
VYGYALGEILTQSLFAVRAQFGSRFEPLYLDLLSSGSTRNIVDLLKPFGLNPLDTRFWSTGIESGLAALLAEAESLAGKAVDTH